jgi:hypothetical protein
VAGISALLCAKSFKLSERLADGRSHRILPKDATDVYRMLLASAPADVAATYLAAHSHERFAPTAAEGRERFVSTFGPQGGGRRLVVDELRTTTGRDDPGAIVDEWVSEFTKRTAALDP